MLVKFPAEGRKLPTTGERQGPNTRVLIAFEDSYRVLLGWKASSSWLRISMEIS
jgi:hypothetical protein